MPVRVAAFVSCLAFALAACDGPGASGRGVPTGPVGTGQANSGAALTARGGTRADGKQTLAIENTGAWRCDGAYDALPPGATSRAFVLLCSGGVAGTGVVTPTGRGATITFTLTNGEGGFVSI